MNILLLQIQMTIGLLMYEKEIISNLFQII